MEHYDIIIAGGGAAGLSLAFHLVLSPLRNLRVLIIDKDDDDQLNRNWGYWTDEPTLFDSVQQHVWKRLEFTSLMYGNRFDLGNYRYHLMHGRDFYCYALEQLAACANVTFLKSVIRKVEVGTDIATITTDDGTFTSSWMFDSIIRYSEIKKELSSCHVLRMQFQGWEIETPSPAFDRRAAKLFDLRTPQHDALRFFYLMPYTEKHAFIEYTVFSRSVLPQHEYETALKEYIGTVLGIQEYHLVSKENGAVPLTDYDFPRRTGARVMTIGAKAGRVKPSTGYSFMRIQSDSAQIVASLIKNGHPYAVKRDAAFFRLCDRLMLDVMQEHGAEMCGIFTAMFKHNPIERILRFLDERSNAIEVVLLIATLPPLPFIHAFIRNVILKRY